MRYGLFLFFFVAVSRCFSQEKPLEGIVFDKDSKERVASVNIRNTTTNLADYDNLKGEFKIKAVTGDQLVFSRQGYKPDTIKVQNKAPLAIYLVRLVIQLKEVTVRDSMETPEKRLEAIKSDYEKIYGPSANPEWFSVAPYGGAGLSIDAIYNAFSRSGRNAAKLRELIEQDYEQNVIDYRFNRTFVGNVTGLKDQELTSFMFRYRPGFYTTQTMTDYEFITMIRANVRRYRRNQRTYALPSLVN
jgi:hypothetical protein